MAANQFKLLGTRRFLPLFITQFLGAFNDNVFKNALAIMITYRIAEASGMNAQIMVTVAAGIFILPFLLFSASAGQFADKYEKVKLIRLVKLAEVAIMLLSAAALYLQNVYILIALLFLLGMQATFFGPMKYAILPIQLKENELIAGNGLVEAGTFIAILLGTLFSGILVLTTHGTFIISASIVAIAVLGYVSALFIPGTDQRNPDIKLNPNFISETARLLRYSKARWDIYLSVLGISWFWLVGAVYLSELPVFAKSMLNANEHVVTWFFALFSIGIALGSMLCNRLLRGQVNATFVPLAAIGMSVFAFDMYRVANMVQPNMSQGLLDLTTYLSTFSGWHISLDLLFLSMCGGLYTVPLYAILQHRSTPSHRARVIASNNVMNSLFMVVAAVGTVVMLQLNYTVNDVFLVIAILNIFVAIYISKLLPDLLLKSILRLVLTALYGVKVHGLENYYNAGKRVVIIANHTSFLDAALFAAFLPDKPTFAIDKRTSEKWWVRWFLPLVDAYPVDATNPMAVKSIIQLVKRNKRCVIFPEGRITVTGALMKIYEGPGMVADKANAVLLPICIQGAQYTPFSRMRGKMPIKIFPDITLTIFPARKLEVTPELRGRRRRYEIGQQLYELMTNIVFDSSDIKQTLFSTLIDAKSIHGNHYQIAEDIDFTPITYYQLILRSYILGKFIAKKTQPREFVGIMLPNMVSTIVTFFAMQAYLRVPAILNFTSGVRNVLHACRIAKLNTIYTSRRFIDTAKLHHLVDEMVKAGLTIIYLEDIRNKVDWVTKLEGSVMASFPAIFYRRINRKKERTASQQPAVVLFTSGSEGTPKGVVLTHQNLQANRYQISSIVDFTTQDKVFNALPMFHTFGLSGGMLLPVLFGIRVFLYPSPLHYRVVPQLVYNLNATILFGTDTFLMAYANHAHPYDFYSLRYVFSGAEKLRPETVAIWSNKFGVRIFDGYGATETAPVIAINTPMQNRPGTVGRLLPGIHYELRPVAGIEEGGELWVSGPNVMKGYLMANEPGTIQPPQDGWYATGDIVSVNSEGFVTILGRVKRFAKVGGEMVSLTMVEQYISKLWPTHQHAVVAVPDARKGEQLVLVTTMASASREEIVKYARSEQVNEISIPRKIVPVSKLPLLGSGKVDYTEVNALVTCL